MPERRTSGLVFAVILALAFLVCSLLPAITGGLWGRFGDQVLKTALTEPLWRMRLGLNIGLFAIALLALHLSFGGFCWIMGAVSQTAWPQVRGGRRQWILLWFIAGIFWLLATNAAWFPNTMLGFPYHRLVATRVFGLSIYAWASIGLGGLTLATIAVALARSPHYRWPAIALTSFGAAAATIPNWPAAAVTARNQDRPNVILIGIDSLRIDAANQDRMPNVTTFLTRAALADDAITPLARTFPSWTSILTGRNPHTTGAFMNLLPRSRIDAGETLPATLHNHGYRTVYAIDETRFSNIDASYGFDQILTPRIGASDFVLGTFADLPLLNLVVNTRVGHWLFPHIHANRAAYNVYEPKTFIRRLDREVRHDKPLFLAVHLTLPHWPYTWATSRLHPVDGSTQKGHYLDTLRRVDGQFAQLLQTLERHGALKNAVVVLLSDHGQAFAGDDVLTVSGDDQLIRTANFDTEGHGTSVFSPMQYRVVLGFRGYGPAEDLLGDPGSFLGPASLVDIAPTVLDLLNIQPSQEFDGVSLAPLLVRNASPQQPDLTDRLRFTETEYRPVNFSEDDVTGSALKEAARVYQVDPKTDRVTVRAESLDNILDSRQYAAFLGDRAFAAAIPGVRKDGRRQLLFIANPFHPKDLRGTVSAADRQRLKAALQQTFSLDLVDPEFTDH